ncbi:MAG: molybdopterin-dependent oxidoreductase [Gammaproteobacteria bacterium]|nr:molybdopterin-dependent oxidoreductase [Gammaproteobacteria bacterium]
MKSVKVDRRSFLKMLGWGGAGTALTGCDLPTTITLEEGKEEVVSYLLPEEYVIPGIGVWYSSTCGQCSAGCGVHGRVREGRALKVEGNPDSPINNGNTCMMGQAGVQAHYNPDRITAPMMRKGNSLQQVSWEEAIAEINKRTSGMSGDRFAFVTGAVSGHQSVLVSDYLKAVGSSNHVVHEPINTALWQQVCKDMLGDSMPRFRLDKAKVVLSFGADFLGTWMSPVLMAGEYAKFRKGENGRGVLITVEPKMTLTGSNSDLWVTANPGSEGALALGIANFIVDRGWSKVDVPADVKKALAAYDLAKVEEITGVEASKIKRIASLLSEHSPALVLAGESATGHENGYESASSIMLLNIIMGSVGETIEGGVKFPEASLQARTGNTSDIRNFAKGLAAGRFDVAFFYNANPVYSAPKSMNLTENLDRVKLKVAFSMFPDETTLKADIVLPIHSYLEDWGTHVPAYQNGAAVLSFQQPLMEPLHKGTRGFGDVMLDLLKKRSSKYNEFADYYAYLRTAAKNMPATVANGLGSDAGWNALLQKGVLKTKGTQSKLVSSLKVSKVAGYKKQNDFPMTLAPSARLGIWDGRHANIPWLQEAPDQISKVVWGSWAEMHPKTAAHLGVHNGDYVRVTSSTGSIEAQVYTHKGIHPDVVSVPMGQGHTDYGRYAKGRGVNPMSILDLLADKKTGELATHATRVKVEKANKHAVLVRMGGSETQMGRSFVRTVSADVLRRTEEG